MPLPPVLSPPPPRAVAILSLCASITVLYWLATSGASGQVAPTWVALSIAACQALLNVASHLAIAASYFVESFVRTSTFSAFCRHAAYFPAARFFAAWHFAASVAPACAVPTQSSVVHAATVIANFVIVNLHRLEFWLNATRQFPIAKRRKGPSPDPFRRSWNRPIPISYLARAKTAMALPARETT